MHISIGWFLPPFGLEVLGVPRFYETLKSGRAQLSVDSMGDPYRGKDGDLEKYGTWDLWGLGFRFLEVFSFFFFPEKL